MYRRAAGISFVLAGSGGCLFKLYQHHMIGMVPDSTVYTSLPLKLPSRHLMIERMKNEKFDLIVIGGGATGSGVAYDAATRGIKCALIEKDDFGSGTSSRSTKLIHGGVRYLESAIKNFDFGQLQLVWEALEERTHLIKSASYMSKAIPIIMPIYQLWQVPYFWIGIKAYDWLAKFVTWFDTGVPNCFYISKANSTFFFPKLKNDGLKGAIVYYDGQHNDSRMNLALAFSSALPNIVNGSEPAAIANHLPVTQILKDSTGKTVGVRVEDATTKESFNIYAKVVMNCTGPGADVIRQLADPDCEPLLETASGSHIVLPKSYTPYHFGLLVTRTSDGRVVFMLPWEDNTIVGTTDIKASLSDLPQASEAEVEFLVTEISEYLNTDSETLRNDIKATWAGLRPLVKTTNCDNQPTCKASRSHKIVEDPNGLISVLGGKWTTYRRMAQDALDYVTVNHPAGIVPTAPCRTKQLLFYPSIDTEKDIAKQSLPQLFFCQKVDISQLPRQLQNDYKVTYEQAAHLVRNYGYQSRNVCALGASENLLTPITPSQPMLKAEILYSIRYEMALTCADVLGRRIRIAFVDALVAKQLVHEVIRMLGSELHWDQKRLQLETNNANNFMETMLASTLRSVSAEES